MRVSRVRLTLRKRILVPERRSLLLLCCRFSASRKMLILFANTGRAAAIAAQRKSFDLCDDSEGLGVGKVLSDPEYLKLFGYGPAAEPPKKNDEEAKATEKTAAEDAPKENGTVNEAHGVGESGAEHKQNGIPVKAEELLTTKNVEIAQAIPKEVANTA